MMHRAAAVNAAEAALLATSARIIQLGHTDRTDGGIIAAWLPGPPRRPNGLLQPKSTRCAAQPTGARYA